MTDPSTPHAAHSTRDLDWPGAIWTVAMYLLGFAGVACLAYALFTWLHIA